MIIIDRNKVILSGLLIFLFDIAFDYINIKLEIYRINSFDFDFGKLDEHLTLCIERLQKQTEGEQDNKYQLCEDEKQSSTPHDDLRMQGIIENPNKEFEELLLTYKKVSDKLYQIDQKRQQLEQTPGNACIHLTRKPLVIRHRILC